MMQQEMVLRLHGNDRRRQRYDGTSRLGLNSRFANEHACVTYLFRRRWPLGFRCPFCGAVQKETAPAYTVVCRYCRKQTSITAQTIMHGSKMDLVAWLQRCSA